MLLRRFTFLCFLLIGAVVTAQIFTWKNPNVNDSLSTDSLYAKILETQTLGKDTVPVFQKVRTEIPDEGILKKNTRDDLFGELNSKGSIIRGLTFGNNMGQSVQSSMEMQFAGRLNKDISVLASISDHNLPIQSDGYTQTLNEFDKIYIQLNIKEKNILRAGHLDLNQSESFFSRYQRRTMGMGFQTQIGKENKTSINISAGVARSEFHRIRFQGVEGNQGPYRLTGRNGENFITLISGSEQVYIDGILQQRGENQDYLINYNTGEITFTSFRPILHQNFITVSYNYTNRNYNRFLVTADATHRREKLTLSVSAFMENDNKNAPLSLDLSREDQEILAQAGNDAAKMIAPSAQRSDWDVNKILYERVGTGSGYYYRYSTQKEAELYQVSYSYAGSGKGDYQLKQSAANGRVFEYAGAGNGDYAAVRRLPAPQKSQVFSTAAEYDWGQGKTGVDFSLSNYDVNLFSSKNNGENFGYAGRIWAHKIFNKSGWTGIPSLEYQHINARFHILDRINTVEFSRDFNLANEFNQRTQNRLIFNMLNSWKNSSFLNYSFNFLKEEDFYKGIKNEVDLFIKKAGIETRGNFSYLDTKASFQDTRFIRGNLISEFFRKRGSWSGGALMEHNVKNFPDAQLLDVTSFSWREGFVQKKLGDSVRTSLLSKVYFRTNDSVRDNRLQKINDILGIRAESELIKNDKTQLSALLHYRKFFYQDQHFATSQNQDFVVGNLQYNQQLFKNGLRLQSFYELGNGQEAQREFQYLRVTDGQGIYKWTDYNGDGSQQLDEFEIAEYADLAQYIRIYTNTVQYSPSNKNKLQLAVFVDPATVFQLSNPFLKRWNFNVSFLSQNSYLKGDRILVINPFLREEDQILKNQNLLASVQFNASGNSGFNGNYRFIDNINLLNANFSQEERTLTSHMLNLGYLFRKGFRADWENTLQNSQNSSQLFASRNYQLAEMETRPKITWELNDKLQSELQAAYKVRKRSDGEERLEGSEVSGSLQWELVKSSLRGQFSFIDNRFSGNSYSIVGNQMLEGLKPGKNYLWNFFFQQQINSFLQLNVNYDGRNSADRTIHIGSVQIRASF